MEEEKSALPLPSFPGEEEKATPLNQEEENSPLLPGEEASEGSPCNSTKGELAALKAKLAAMERKLNYWTDLVQEIAGKCSSSRRENMANPRARGGGGRFQQLKNSLMFASHTIHSARSNKKCQETSVEEHFTRCYKSVSRQVRQVSFGR